jgi:tetratricopeptide (TPR) repeat protein
MRSLLFYIIVLASFSCLFSCKNEHSGAVDHDIRMYHQAIKFGDVGTAIHAMQSVLAWDSTRTGCYDTLAVLYFHSQNFPQAIQAAQVILDKDTKNVKLLQIAAHSYQFLGRHDLAIAYYAKLEEIKPDPLVYYELASSNFYVRDFEKVKSYSDKIMADKRSDTTKVNISFNQGRDQQDVPVKAATLNLLGTLEMNRDKKQEAVENYKKALEIFPDFGLAKQNLDYLNKPAK